MDKQAVQMLIVDEDIPYDSQIKQQLDEEQIVVDYADSEFQVFSMLLDKMYDFVLIDLAKPGIDAAQICSRIRSDIDMQEVKIILLAPALVKLDVISFERYAIDDYIIKPCYPHEIIDRIKISQMLDSAGMLKRQKLQRKEQEAELLSRKVARLEKELLEYGEKKKILLESSKEYFNVARNKYHFIRTIGHELLTPVSAIFGFVEILRDDPSSVDKTDILETIYSAAGKIKSLTDFSLLIAQIDPEYLPGNLRPANISKLVEFAVSDMQKSIHEKQISIEHPDKRNYPEVIIEPALIKEVIRVFLTNAIHYCKKEGCIRISIAENTDTLELSIDDDGRGFSLEEQQQINHFLDSKDISKRSDWPGMGFAFARFIADVHRVRIRIANNEMGGARVVLVFPINLVKSNKLNQLLSQLN